MIFRSEREGTAKEMAPQLLRGAGSYFFEGSPVGYLLVHGMGSTSYQVRSLGEYFAWQGLTVLGLRLPGHGNDARRSRAEHAVWFPWRMRTT